MKIKLFSIFPLIVILSLFLWEDDEPDNNQIIHTGIMLDSMENEVMLMYQNNQPKCYFSNIFTPVCNTGECLPVKINIYWDLTGKFLKFDQPEGEILTKLDHEPFTEDDYNLLDEILRGPDPRYGGITAIENPGVKHSKGDHQDTQSQPAPGSMSKVSKYDMVDGITGSTLPEIKNQFVPGALYTTYTLWGLANDHQYKIRSYTMTELINDKHYNYLLLSGNRELQDLVIGQISAEETGDNSRRKVLLALLDTASVDIQVMTLNKFYWDDYRSDEVQLAFHNKFYQGHTDIEVRRYILARWAYNYITESGMKMLSVNVHTNQELMDEIVALYLNKLSWPESVFENLIKEMEKLDPANQVKLMNLFKSHKDYLSKDEWKVVKELEK